jgi:protein-disulfide isomerase
VNRRRILAGILSLGLLGLLALLLPSLHKSPECVSTAPQSSAPAPALPVDASTSSETAAIPTPALVADAAPRPPAPQTASGLPDVDPHKAFGSKTAPISLEVFSDFQCPACKNLYLTTNRRLRDAYVSSGKVYLIERDFPLPMHAYSRVAASYSRAAAHIGVRSTWIVYLYSG